MDNIFLGTTVKIAVTVQGTPNVKLSTCNYDLYVWASAKNDIYQDKPATGVVHRTKDDSLTIDDYSCSIEVATGLIGKGYVIARIECQVPDADCSGGYRPEVYQMTTDLKVV